MLLDELLKNETNFPQTLIYNEGWLLRIVLNWVYENETSLDKIDYVKNTSWFSEGLLASPFHHKSRSDKLAEGKTSADGVMGHFVISKGRKADIQLINQGTYFAIFEAKLFSVFSPGTKYFPKYNQVSRNIACMANLLTPDHYQSYSTIRFSAIYPKERNKESDFLSYLDKNRIKDDVYNRIKSYKSDNRQDEYEKHNYWFENYFLNFLSNIKIQKIEWESVIDEILSNDIEFGKELKSYYQKCVLHNKKHNKPNQAD